MLSLDHFRILLKSARDALIAEDRMAEQDRAPVALDQESVGRLSRIDAMQMQAMALAQARRRRNERMAVDAALARIDEGEFGFCLRCGDAIAEPRLLHNPSVATCIECARNE